MNEHDVITKLAAFPDDVTLHVDVDAAIASVKLQRKRRRFVAAAVLSTIALIAGILVVTSQVDRSTQPTNKGTWKVNTPDIEGAEFWPIAAVSQSDVWTFGGVRSTRTALAMHWDGTRWQRFDLPNGNSPTDLSVVAPDDIWGVGVVETFNGTQSTGRRSLTMHWDGHSWREVPVPTRGKYSDLTSVVAIAANDVWAIGNIEQDTEPGHPYIVHWDGHTWQLVDTPAVPGASDMLLRGISATSANDIWIGGMSNASPGERPLSLHWDGHQWTPVPVTDQGGDIRDILALSPNDVWALGREELFHWNGTSWQRVAVPTRFDGNYWVLAPDGAGGIVAAGNPLVCPSPSCPQQSSKDFHLQIARWNGTTWALIPPPSDTTGTVRSLTHIPNTNTIWITAALEPATTLIASTTLH